MENDILPAGYSGQLFAKEPTQQVTETSQKRTDTLAQLPLLKEVLEHIDARIAFYDSVNSVPEEVHTKPEEFMHVIAANKLTRDNLLAERGFIQSRIGNL